MCVFEQVKAFGSIPIILPYPLDPREAHQIPSFPCFSLLSKVSILWPAWPVLTGWSDSSFFASWVAVPFSVQPGAETTPTIQMREFNTKDCWQAQGCPTGKEARREANLMSWSMEVVTAGSSHTPPPRGGGSTGTRQETQIPKLRNSEDGHGAETQMPEEKAQRLLVSDLREEAPSLVALMSPTWSRCKKADPELRDFNWDSVAAIGRKLRQLHNEGRLGCSQEPKPTASRWGEAFSS